MIKFKEELVKIDEPDDDHIINIIAVIQTTDDSVEDFYYSLLFTTVDRKTNTPIATNRITFVLPIYNESFIVRFTEFVLCIYLWFDDVKTTVKIINNELLMLKNSELKDYIINNGDIYYEYEDFMYLLCMLNPLYSDEYNEIMYEDFIEKYPDLEEFSLINVERMFRPALHTLDNFSFKVAFDMCTTYKSWISKNFKEYTDITIQIISKFIYIDYMYSEKPKLITEEFKNTLLKDCTYDNTDKYSDHYEIDLIQIFINEETAKYMNNLTVSQVHMLIEFLNNNRTKLLTLDRIKVINDHRVLDSDYVEKSLENFSQKAKQNKNTNKYYVEITCDRIIRKFEKDPSSFYNLSVILEEFNKNDSFSSDVVEYLMEYADHRSDLSHSINGWSYADTIIFIKKIGLENYVKFFNDVQDSDIKFNSLTVQQLNNYADHYEEYKDVPFAWVIELIS